MDNNIKSPLLPPIRVKVFIKQPNTGNFKETNESKDAKHEISLQENVVCEGCELPELHITKTYWEEDKLRL